MPDEKREAITVERIYEQPADAISFYCDFAQVVSTGNEVALQFYETIPGPPSQTGQIRSVRSRLRATIYVSVPHAATIGKLLTERTNKVLVK